MPGEPRGSDRWEQRHCQFCDRVVGSGYKIQAIAPPEVCCATCWAERPPMPDPARDPGPGPAPGPP